MNDLIIKTDKDESHILVGESIANLSNYLPTGKKVIIITDSFVRSLYGKKFPKADVIEIGLGEKIKTLQTIAFIYEKLVEFEADRTAFIVGIGGGIVCDITGFVASTFMRGLDFGFISTTLLSQVDASIGGKNGVNFLGYKNMIGVFAQPRFVICDFDMLRTLKERDYISGLAEIVKAALIKNKDLFTFIVSNYSRALQLDKEVMQKLIYESLVIKKEVVQADEHEKGERRKLNFGHTLGHAIEKLTGIMHGEAVSIGMVMAAMLSEHRGMLTQKESDRIRRLLLGLQLPVNVNIDKEKIFEALKKDKKREGESINFVLLNGIGNAVVEKVTLKELEEMLDVLQLHS